MTIGQAMEEVANVISTSRPISQRDKSLENDLFTYIQATEAAALILEKLRPIGLIDIPTEFVKSKEAGEDDIGTDVAANLLAELRGDPEALAPPDDAEIEKLRTALGTTLMRRVKEE